MNKEIRKIFLILILYSFAGGLFYYFQEFWLAENNLTSKTIGITLGLCCLITCSVIFLCTNIITISRIKKTMQLLLYTKSILLFLLYLLYKSGFNILIKFLTIFEYSIDTELLILFYPLISQIIKDNKVYALKDIVYQAAYYIGSLLVMIFIGRKILFISTSHNTFLLISTILTFIAGGLIGSIKMPKIKEEIYNNDVLLKLMKKIKMDNISKSYLLFLFFSSIAVYTIIGLFLTTLVKVLYYTEEFASYIKLLTGIASAFTAIFVLYKLTFKNNYLNIILKFSGRVFLYLLAVIFPNKYIILLAFIFTLLSLTWYSHVTEAPYINRLSKDEQLAFANLSEIVRYFGRAIGTFLCSYLFLITIRLNFFLALFFLVIAMYFAFKTLKLYSKESGKYDW